MLIVIAGGPIASLAVLVCAVYCLASGSLAGPAAYFFSVVAQINLFLFVLGLVPNSANACVRNDARLFLTLLQNSSEAEQMKLYHLVTRLQIAGVRPSAYPRELIARLACAQGNPDLMLFNALTIYLWALDSEDLITADAWDRHANALLEENVLRLSTTVLCESACFDLLHRNHPQSAAQKIKATTPATLSPWLRYRAEAALQIAEGSYANARLSLRNARASIPALRPYFEFELTMLDLLERRAIIADSELLSARAAA
jgi:hypothetical protein